jgi:hypothetical protein
MRCFVLLAALVAVALFVSGTATAQDQDSWTPLRFLIGDWDAVPKPGEASGRFEFRFDLQNSVVVRRNHADYPAIDGRAAYNHDDLMIIYHEGSPSVLRAMYFDNEGHVIRYTVQTGDARIAFLSDIAPNQPRYRLSYAKMVDGRLSGRFEIAPPGQPDAFKSYLDWLAVTSRSKRQ